MEGAVGIFVRTVLREMVLYYQGVAMIKRYFFGLGWGWMDG